MDIAMKCRCEGCANTAKRGGVCVAHGARKKRCSHDRTPHSRHGGIPAQDPEKDALAGGCALLVRSRRTAPPRRRTRRRSRRTSPSPSPGRIRKCDLRKTTTMPDNNDGRRCRPAHRNPAGACTAGTCPRLDLTRTPGSSSSWRTSWSRSPPPPAKQPCPSTPERTRCRRRRRRRRRRHRRRRRLRRRHRRSRAVVPPRKDSIHTPPRGQECTRPPPCITLMFHFV